MTTPPARGGQALPPKPSAPGVKAAPSAQTIRDSQKCVIRSITPPLLSVTALLDATRPQATAGYGGWTILPRSKRRSVLEWDGGAPWVIDVMLILDSPQGDIEDDAAALEEMAISPGPLTAPPTVTITGPFSKATAAAQWVITDLTWNACIVNTDGSRRQQFVTVELTQRATEDLASSATKAAKMQAKNTTPYKVKKGDTLDSIAQQQLGKASLKSEIIALNLATLGKDPRNLKPGMTLKLPPKSS